MTTSTYPFQGHYLKLNKLAYHYLDEGQGEPVLMVHGNPSWSYYYRNLAMALRKEYRVIVPDHMGCGYSDKPSDDQYHYTLQQRIDDLDALMDHLSIEAPINLVLHDWGGLIGMGYAVKHPEKIKSITILNTAAFHLPEGKRLPWELYLSRSPLGTLLIRRFNAFSRTTAWIGCRRHPMSKELRDAYCAPYNSYQNRIATLRFVQDIPLSPKDEAYSVVTNIQNQLKRFEQLPILICWGEKDPVFDTDYLREWEKVFPSARIHRFPDCGHYILEDAQDEVIPLIHSFLKSKKTYDQ
ncbi:MAG: alpha/beta hydrolase [Waddliaceae bacterium]|nr:alpha/beta hydrolase [Waddliaceae bacterium]